MSRKDILYLPWPVAHHGSKPFPCLELREDGFLSVASRAVLNPQ